MKHPWKRSLACLVALLLMLRLFPHRRSGCRAEVGR